MLSWASIGDWLYQKRMIHSSPLLETLAYAEHVLCPNFVTVADYVFLDCKNENVYSYASCKETDSQKIVTEALENHVHLFDNVPKHMRKDVRKIAIAVAQNLFERLKYDFPDKHFVVLLELKYKESIVVRFHQIRQNCALYIDPKEFPKEYANGLFMMFI